MTGTTTTTVAAGAQLHHISQQILGFSLIFDGWMVFVAMLLLLIAYRVGRPR